MAERFLITNLYNVYAKAEVNRMSFLNPTLNNAFFQKKKKMFFFVGAIPGFLWSIAFSILLRKEKFSFYDYRIMWGLSGLGMILIGLFLFSFSAQLSWFYYYRFSPFFKLIFSRVAPYSTYKLQGECIWKLGAVVFLGLGTSWILISIIFFILKFIL